MKLNSNAAFDFKMSYDPLTQMSFIGMSQMDKVSCLLPYRENNNKTSLFSIIANHSNTQNTAYKAKVHNVVISNFNFSSEQTYEHEHGKMF